MHKSWIPRFVLAQMERRADLMVSRILPFLKNSKTVIDVGCGNCLIAHRLERAGKRVVAVDIRDQSLEPTVPVTVFDGGRLPFKDKMFDTGFLLTVMHHTPTPEMTFAEVARVSREVIVIETSYRNILEKLFIVLFDSVLNRQLRFFWRSYRSDSSWRQFFEKQGFRIVKSEKYIDMQGAPYFHPLYYLIPKKPVI